MSFKKVNVSKVLKQKNKTLYHIIPWFLISYLRKIVHEDDINEFLSKYHTKKDLEFIDCILSYYNVNVRQKGLEDIPQDKNYIFASNHPLGGADGIAIIRLISHRFPNVKALVNDILLNIEYLRGVFLPINKHGKQGREGLKQIEDAYNSDTQILTFPFGLCSRKKNGVVQDLVWNKNFIKKAIEKQRDVVPVYFHGRNSNFFYNLSNIRKKLGIKINIEMLYLVDEFYKNNDKTFQVVFGKPIPYTTFDKSKTLDEWAEYMRLKVYELQKEID